MMAAAFMITSKPSCRRRSAGLFLTPAKNHLLRPAVVVLMTMVLLTASAVAELAQVDGVTYIHGCMDLVNDRTPVHGHVCIVGDVLCDVTKTIELTEGYDQVIIVAKNAIRTKGLRFEVRQGATLSFGGPAFFFERKQDNTDAIFQVDGFLGFEADDATYEAPQSATPEDLHGLIRTNPGASVSALLDSAIYHTEDTVIAVNNTKTKNKSRGNDKADTDRANSNTGTGTSNTDTGITDTSSAGTGITDTGITDISNTGTSNTDIGTSNTGTSNTDTGITDSSNTDTGITDISNTDIGMTGTSNTDIGITDSSNTNTGITGTPNTGTSMTDIGITDSSNTDTGTSNTDIGITDSSNTDMDSARPTLPVADDLPISTLHSCDELRSERTHVQGMSGALLLDCDILCTETRVLEVTDKLLVISDKPHLRLEGVHFHVREHAALTFIVPTLTMEKLEGVSGQLFTIEPQGSVAMSADQWVSSPENGTEEDLFSLVAVKKGGSFELEEGHARYTASTMTFFMQDQQQEEQRQQQQQTNNNNNNNNNPGVSQSTTEPPHQQQQQQQQQDNSSNNNNNDPVMPPSTAEPPHSTADVNEQQQQTNNNNNHNPGVSRSTAEPPHSTADNINDLHAAADATNVKATEKETYRHSIPRTQGYPETSFINRLPIRSLGSCDELPLDRNRLDGAVYITGPIVCDEKRVIEIGQETVIFTRSPDLYLMGVHFLIRENAGLWISMGTMTVEALEGDSEEFFTVEPQGHLGLFANEVGPVSEKGTPEDLFSRLVVKSGGALVIEGRMSCATSIMTIIKASDTQKQQQLQQEEEQQQQQQHTERQQEQQQQQQQQEEQQQQGDVLPQHPQNGDNKNKNYNNSPATASSDADSYRGNTNTHTTKKIKAMRDRLFYKDSGDTPMTTIKSCYRIPFGLTPVRGILIIEGDIVCTEKRTLVVSELALIFSDMDGVRFEGVHFRVEQNATLSFAVASLLVEKLEGDSGEIFTIEPGGFLGGHADQLRPLPENGTKKDKHSLLHANEGGEFYFDALVLYTSSSITMVAVPVIEDPAWIRLQRLRRRWIERHFQFHQQQVKQQQGKQHQQQQRQQPQQTKHDGGQSACTAAASLTCGPNQSPFSPDRSAEYTYEQRLNLNPTHLMVGEELRFPSSLTTLDRSHTMTVGTDGSLVLAKADRYVYLFDEMMEAVETRASVDETTIATLAELSPDYDGGDPGLKLKILALADSSQAIDDKVLHMMARSESLRVWQKETATDMEVDLEKCERDFDELLRAKKREKDLKMKKEEEEEKKKEEVEKTAMPQQQADPTTAGHSGDPKQEHAGQNASSSSTSTSTSGRGKTKAKTVPATVTRYWGDEARRYWGDDVALKVTNTGDVLVTVGNLVVVEKRNPMIQKKESWLQRKVGKSKPVKKIKDIFGRLGRRGKGNGKTYNNARNDDDDDDDGRGDSDGAPVSTMYSLHVVENGLEVRLEGVFMWGWYAE